MWVKDSGRLNQMKMDSGTAADTVSLRSTLCVL